MQLFLDVDGVLLNFERAFVKWLNSAYGMSLPPDYETTCWHFSEIMTREEAQHRWETFIESPLASQLPPLINPERFNHLTQDHEVHLLTNFPSAHMDKRRHNLERVGLRYHTLHHGGLHGLDGQRPPTKSELVEELRTPGEAALFVDDHPDNCLDVSQNCPQVEVWLMSRRFNQGFAHPTVRRAQDWGCMTERLNLAG